MASLVETISKVFINPSSPTPQSLSRYNLSSSDQIMPLVNGSFAFFYTHCDNESSTIRLQLQNSLSKTLVHYYPFAGRLIDNSHIDCNDQGVEFVEVRIYCPIYDILEKIRSDAADLVFPRGRVAGTKDSLVAVQLSHFDCGGVAIAVCVYHKVADASSLVAFIKDWAASTCLSSHVPAPLLLADSFSPGHDNLLPVPFVPAQNCIARRFVFTGEEIEKLKSKAVESGVQQPSRVEVVTALLYQRIMLATRSTNYGLSKPSVIISAINLRPFLALPENSVGNIYSFYFCISNDDKMEFPVLVDQLRKARLKFQNFPREKLSYESQLQELGECLKQLNTSSFDIYHCTSSCGFPIYDVDFGWGKPIRVSAFESQLKDLLILMDSPGDGVEATVILGEEKMSAVENNQQLPSFDSLYSAKFKSKL